MPPSRSSTRPSTAPAGSTRTRSAASRSTSSTASLTSPGLRSRGRYPNVQYLRGRNPVFGIDAAAGLLRPTFEGWSLLGDGYRVEIDDFVPQGDVLAPGVLDADPRIRPGDEVLVVGPSALATGRAAMSAGEMLRSTRGVAVRRRKVMKREHE